MPWELGVGKCIDEKYRHKLIYQSMLTWLIILYISINRQKNAGTNIISYPNLHVLPAFYPQNCVAGTRTFHTPDKAYPHPSCTRKYVTVGTRMPAPR